MFPSILIQLENGPNEFLAHLSQRLVGELINSIPMLRRLSVVHNFKHEYLCNQWANHNEILSEASLG